MNINYNVVIRIITPIKPDVVKNTPKLNFKTVGASAATICLVISEALPFVNDVSGNGLLHGAVKYFQNDK